MPQNTDPISVQVAFQGGGAKLPALLAVADALKDAEDKGKIVITKLAGTSAGSIAASMLATRPDFECLRELFLSNEAARIAKNLSPPSTAKMIWSAVWGKPIRTFKPLRLFLKKFFDKENVYKIRDLDIDTKISYTNLSNSEVRPCNRNDDISLAIENSCAIPIFFSTWKNSQGRVDGGVGENLPVNLLLKEKGESDCQDQILAVTFKKQGGRKMEGPKDFFLSIIDTAISSNESKSIDLVDKDALHVITTTLDTFDFCNAFENGFGSDYDVVKSKADKWIERLIESYHAAEFIKANFWRDENTNLKNVMRRTCDMYRNLIKGAKFTTSNVVFEVFAWSLKNEKSNDPDMARLRFNFEVDSESLPALSICFFETDPDTKFMPQAKYTIKDKNNNPVESVSIPLLRGKDKDDRTLGIFFKQPLLKDSGPYSFKYEETGHELLKQLKDNKEETLFYNPDSTFQSKPISNVKLIAHIPSDVDVSIISNQDPVIGNLMSSSEFNTDSQFPNFSTLGWSCEELDPFSDGLIAKLMVK